MQRGREHLKARPFLKWAGGKWGLLSQYEPFFPRDWGTYHEPFLGGGAVFFHLAQVYPERGFVLSDINADLVNAYCCVRDRVEEVVALLAYHQAHHSRDYYYALRASKPVDPVQRAARLIYLNKTCYNGLYRENASGEFNVPLGRYRNPRICDADNLRAASRVLQRAKILVQSFEQVLERAQPGDFVYLDPPYYPVSETSSFTAYSQYAFGQAEQIRLREVFGILADRGVHVLLSNSDCTFVRELYRGYPIHTIVASRAINCHGRKRGPVTEVLVLSR
ncbi:DNA adenine methylase [Synechococcus sp. WC10meta]|uniref:DNA adenine methylase n=1 Tax=Synechococcus sp. WC10meta TaxID=2964537 RepID=UPI0039C42C29